MLVDVSGTRDEGLVGAEPEGSGSVDPRFEAELQSALQRARETWPTLDVEAAQFLEELKRRLPDRHDNAGDAAASIAAIHASDLYLAIACANGEKAALMAFDARYAGDIRAAVLRMGFTASVADEALQTMRAELFVNTPAARPKILNYAGTGELRAWVRAVAARSGIRAGRKPTNATVPLHDSMVVAGDDDLELEYMKRTYGAVFLEAFRDAFESAEPADRLLLKQRFRHGLGVEELGEFYGVHASTVTRRVQSARERLIVATRNAMIARLDIDREEVSSILRLIESRVDITLSTVG
jgi:RNA polymerase sigma-70 factor (ECF subfamily)